VDGILNRNRFISLEFPVFFFLREMQGFIAKSGDVSI